MTIEDGGTTAACKPYIVEDPVFDLTYSRTNPNRTAQLGI